MKRTFRESLTERGFLPALKDRVSTAHPLMTELETMARLNAKRERIRDSVQSTLDEHRAINLSAAKNAALVSLMHQEQTASPAFLAIARATTQAELDAAVEQGHVTT